MKISAVVITKNEEKNIQGCLKKVQWCDEVIVIDDHSTDRTVSLAEKSGAKVYTHSLENNFSQQRNVGLEKAKGEWVLFVDADERVSGSLANEIQAMIIENNFDGFYIKREDTMWGKVLHHGEVGNIRLLRFAKKNKGKWYGNVHETWHVSGKVHTLQNALQHYPHTTISEFLQEINFYTTLRAKELYQQKVRVPWWHIIAYPKAKFIQNYVFRLGFLDGMPGIVLAFMMSLHSFLVRGKLWQLWQEK